MEMLNLDNILPIFSTVLVLIGILLVIKFIFKVTIKIFMFGCLGILLFAVFSIVTSVLGIN